MGIANIINTSSSSGGGGSFGSLDIGNGLGGDPDSTAVGQNALDSSLSTSVENTAIGNNTLTSINHADGDRNTAVGSGASATIASGADTTSVGYNALNVFTGSNATAVGSGAADAVARDHRKVFVSLLTSRYLWARNGSCSLNGGGGCFSASMLMGLVCPGELSLSVFLSGSFRVPSCISFCDAIVLYLFACI